jgi:hypothetical protein
MNTLQQRSISWKSCLSAGRWRILPALTCFAACLSSVGQAPTTCIPQAVGVPGFSNPQPNWYTNNNSSDYQPSWDTQIKQFHDPRWRAAVSHDYGAGAGNSDAEFRALFNVEPNPNNQNKPTTYLYLSWYVKTAPNITVSWSSLYIGFLQGSNGTILQLIVQSKADLEAAAVGAGSYSATLWTGNGTPQGWTTSNPAWTTQIIPDTQIWVKSNNPYQWAFETRIPVDPTGTNGLQLDPTQDFKMWHEVQISTPPNECQNPSQLGQSCSSDSDCDNTPGSCGTTNLIFYTWPRIDPNDPLSYLYQQEQVGAITKNVFPDPTYSKCRGGSNNLAACTTNNDCNSKICGTTWGDFKVSSNPLSDPSCLNGIYLADDQIGTMKKGLWGSEISLPPGVNTFYANPFNYSATQVPINGMSATFYLANWGSQGGVGDVLSGNCQGGSNKNNACTTDADCPGGGACAGQCQGGSSPMSPATTCTTDSDCVSFSGACVKPSWVPIPTGINQANPTALSAYDSGTQTPGQGGEITANWTLDTHAACLFTGTTGTKDYLGNPVPGNAACTNTNPVLDLDTCLLVKLNAPGFDLNRDSAWTNLEVVAASDFSRRATIRTFPGIPKTYLYVERVNMPSVIDQGWKTLFQKFFGADKQRSQGVLNDAVLRMSDTEKKQVLPTYVVHTYYDTGETVNLNGKQHPILLPQNAFGYYVVPHGNFLGWSSKLEGATQIAPDFYRRAMPSSGIAQVTTTITAVGESGGGGGGGGTQVGKFAVFLDLGANFPQGSFSGHFKNGFSLNAGLEYIAASHLSLEGIFGYHYAPAKAGGSLNIYQFSGDAKYYITTGNIRPFINGGIGGYAFSPGSTHFGGNVGGGVLFTPASFGPHWGLQGSYNFHAVNTPLSTTQFSTFQGGVRYAF